MAYQRTAIKAFELANAAYANATVSFYTVSGGAATTTLATLYDALTGTGTLSNPNTLDASGKFTQPVYIEEPVIGVVSNSTVADHSTGVIYPRLSDADVTAAAASASSAATSASTATAAKNAAEAAQAAAEAATGAVKVSSDDTTPGDLETKLTAGTGVSMATTSPGADERRTVSIDVVGLTAEASVADADLVLIYDDSAGAYRKMTKANFAANLLKLSGGTMTGAIAMGGNAITGAEGVKDIGGAWNAIGTTASAVTLDYTAYNGATFEPTGDLTVSVTNLPAGYSDGGFIITGGGDHTLTFSGFDATMVADLPTLQTTTGVDHLVWWSPDGGTSIYIKHVGVS